jgi:deoxyribonuclease-4
MDNTTKYIGHNLNISNGFVTVADYAKSLDSNFMQIFLSTPQKYGNKRRDIVELKTLDAKLKEYNMKIVIHASYKLNFCNPENSFIHKMAIADLVNNLEDSVILNAIGVVVHMGKNVIKLNLTDDDAINNYVKGIRSTLSKTNINSTIILETGAGVGSEVCTSIFGLSKLYNKFSNEEKKRIKFCIDTCHIYSYGYNIGDVDFVDVFCNLIQDYLGWYNIACIHLNDSKDKVGKCLDHHADLGKGKIKLDGLKKFVKICVNKNIPIVLETPCDTLTKKEQISLVKSWANEI